jgi:hypothetical protein
MSDQLAGRRNVKQMFAELLAKKAQLKFELVEMASSKNSKQKFKAEITKVSREIDKWIKGHPHF